MAFLEQNNEQSHKTITDIKRLLFIHNCHSRTQGERIFCNNENWYLLPVRFCQITYCDILYLLHRLIEKDTCWDLRIDSHQSILKTTLIVIHHWKVMAVCYYIMVYVGQSEVAVVYIQVPCVPTCFHCVTLKYFTVTASKYHSLYLQNPYTASHYSTSPYQVEILWIVLQYCS